MWTQRWCFLFITLSLFYLIIVAFVRLRLYKNSGLINKLLTIRLQPFEECFYRYLGGNSKMAEFRLTSLTRLTRLTRLATMRHFICSTIGPIHSFGHQYFRLCLQHRRLPQSPVMKCRELKMQNAIEISNRSPDAWTWSKVCSCRYTEHQVCI